MNRAVVFGKKVLRPAWVTILVAGCVVACKQEKVQPMPAEEINFSESKVLTCVPEMNTNMVKVDGGYYKPLYSGDSSSVLVNAFMLDEYPVTNEQFLDFVKANPQWRRTEVKKLFGDANYLRAWVNDTTLGEDMLKNAPVTNVSWYAANAYATACGKRLPSVDEWEFAAMADAEQIDARTSEAYTNYILHWYEAPATQNNAIGSTPVNYWGVYDLHGLVWEWTSDFNSVLMSGDLRKDGKSDENLFCGGASFNASNLRDYAAFMRYAFRGSLKANYSIQNLGFRCARDVDKC
jgi:formylglycine-generating enzyme